MAGLPNNDDFLNEANKASSEDNSDTPKKKRRTSLEVEQDKYPEYYALNEYERKCLVANNYWNVLYGNPIVEVPLTDKYYHNNFDKRCYDRIKEYQEQKKRIFEHDNNLKKYREQNEAKKIGQEEQIEKEVELKKTDDNEIEKENKPNGNPVVEDKVTEIKDAIEVSVKEEPEIVKPIVVEKPVENKKKKSNDEQTSLF